MCYDSPGKIKFCDKQVATWESSGPLVSILDPLFSLKHRFDRPLLPASPAPRRGNVISSEMKETTTVFHRMQWCGFLNVAHNNKKRLWNWGVAEMFFFPVKACVFEQEKEINWCFQGGIVRILLFFPPPHHASVYFPATPWDKILIHKPAHLH